MHFRDEACPPVLPGARRMLFAPLFVLTFILLLSVLPACRARTGETTETSSTVSVESANEAYERGDFGKASADLEQIVEEEPGDIEARRLLALSYAAEGKNEEAVEQYQAIVDTDQQDHASFYRMALLERLIGKSNEAVAHLESAAALQEDPTYLDELARTYMQVGRYADAAATWGKVLEGEGVSDQGRVDLLKLQAEAYVNAKQYDDARAALEKALSLAPNDQAAQARLAELD